MAVSPQKWSTGTKLTSNTEYGLVGTDGKSPAKTIFVTDFKCLN